MLVSMLRSQLILKNREELLVVTDNVENVWSCYLHESIEHMGKVVRNIANLMSPLVDVLLRL